MRKEKQTKKSWLIDSVSILFCAGLFYFLWLGHYPLFTPDEGRYSDIARAMLASSHYITPKLNGVPFLDKPILHYWLQIIAMSVFGITEFAARFFPATLGLIGVFISYITGRTIFNRRTGILASTILATSPLYFIGAHYANLDLEVGSLIGCSLLLFLTGMQSYSARWFIAAYVFAGLAVLNKGLIGLAFPLMIVGLWILINNDWKLLKKSRLLTGLLIIAAINIPWYVFAQQENPEFLHYFFITQHITRFLSKATFNNPLPFWFYIPVLLVGIFPWTLYLLQSIKQGIANRNTPQFFLLLWAIVVITFFSIPQSKIVTYILPAFPAISMLIGNYLSKNWSIARKRIVVTLAVFTSISLLTLVYNAEKFNNDSTKVLSSQLASIIKPTDKVADYYRYFYDAPFYSHTKQLIVADWRPETVENKDNWQREMEFAKYASQSKNWLIDENTFWTLWHSKQRVFIYVSDNFLKQFSQHAKKYSVIAKQNDVQLLSNQK